MNGDTICDIYEGVEFRVWEYVKTNVDARSDHLWINLTVFMAAFPYLPNNRMDL